MPRYETKQRKALLAFLADHADESWSAPQIAVSLQNETISVSAVYRNLSTLEEEGMVRRIERAGGREAFFQYIALNQCRDCIHLSCKSCGKIFHMNSLGANDLVRNVAEKDAFLLDKSDTVLYGICRSCQSKAGKK